MDSAWQGPIRLTISADLYYDGLDAIANGQVWTGAQAQAIGLVDEIGDFQTAMLMACDMAGLPTDYSVPIVPVKASGGLLAQPFKQAQDTLGGLSALASAVLRGEVSELFSRERIWFIADGLPKVK
ncbi:MAG: S49 family peptidase [Caldilineaceae bacterium]|nr:S49 family peptidase [Caldilineaceae bacterium]MBP8110193.1 S49 family peptidase [Caldilineaceae bacterium]MBP8123043.1 S49 family peptidase [Caldilineaceae bacterium]